MERTRRWKGLERNAVPSSSRNRIFGAVGSIALGLFAPFGAGCTLTPVVHKIPRLTRLASDYELLPTTASKGYLFVEARIDRAGPFRFLVDTGADGFFLMPSVVQAAALRPLTGQAVGIRGSVERSAGQLFIVDEVEVGGLSLHDITAAKFSEGATIHVEREFGNDFGGVMGMAVFADVILEIDFPNTAVAVRRLSGCNYPRERAAPYTTALRPCVMVDFAGQPVDCLIDTGSNGYLQVPDLRALPLHYPPVKYDGVGAAGIGATTARHESSQLAGEAHLGPVTWRNPPLSRGAHGGIGHAALSLWKIAFDQHEQLVYFLAEQPVAQWAREVPPDPIHKAGYFCTLEGEAVRLLEVDPGLEFDRAGLRAGDLITTINTAPAGSWLTSKEQRARAGSSLAPTFRVLRDGVEFTIVVSFGPPAE